MSATDLAGLINTAKLSVAFLRQQMLKSRR
jgi:hypothetical protein